MIRLIPILFLALSTGCLGSTYDYGRLIPCADRLTVDLTGINGDFDSNSSALSEKFFGGRARSSGSNEMQSTRTNVDGDYDEFRIGGSLSFALGVPPEQCALYGGGPSRIAWQPEARPVAVAPAPLCPTDAEHPLGPCLIRPEEVK